MRGTVIGENAVKRILLVALILFAAATGDASTKLKMSWKNPGYSGQRFTKILVIGMSNNLETRADFEVALASEITRPGIVGVAGTDILLRPTAGPLDLVYIKEQIRAYKIDAVVVSRLVKVETKITYIPGQPYFLPYYNTFSGYYGTVYPAVYSPDYLAKDRTVRVETNAYAVKPPDGELIWTGTSDTFNPGSAHKVIKPLVSLIVKELEREAILPESGK
jgi:outer membrane protein assembly factor BamB